MKNKILCSFIIVTISINTSLPVYATPSTSGDLNSSRLEFQQVNDDIKKIDNSISKLQSEIYTVNTELSNNKKKISSLENEIYTTETKIATSKEEIKETEELLSLRLRESYKSGITSSVNYIGFLFESNGFSDLIDRLFSVKKLIDLDNKMIKNIESKVSALDNDRKLLEEKKIKTETINTKINDNLKLLRAKEASVLKEKEVLNSKKSLISDQIKENEENLVFNLINVINSSNPSITSLNNAIRDLKGLLPQLTNSSVKNNVQAAISKGEELVETLFKGSDSTDPPADGSYLATYTMNASAYYGHTITAMGTVPVRDPNGISTVAVDPTVIPLGSKLYIPNYGYAIAADTGGIIKGMKIDLFMNSYEEAYSFGRRNITVHLISYPGEW
ncbi:MAG: 3D domain-containing protein [Clostridium sp.]